MKNWKKHRLPLILLLVIIGYSCASIGTPDGGPYDEMPPKFIGSNPGMHAVNAKEKKLELEFDANSVVTKDIPPYCIAGGNPCRVIRKRFDEDLKNRSINGKE